MQVLLKELEVRPQVFSIITICQVYCWQVISVSDPTFSTSHWPILHSDQWINQSPQLWKSSNKPGLLLVQCQCSDWCLLLFLFFLSAAAARRRQLRRMRFLGAALWTSAALLLRRRGLLAAPPQRLPLRFCAHLPAAALAVSRQADSLHRESCANLHHEFYITPKTRNRKSRVTLPWYN